MKIFLGMLLSLLLAHSCFAAGEPTRREWTVDGVVREALVYVPETAKTQPTPLVFLFHGHGGVMAATARRFDMHHRWPEAIVVCPQGLNTPGRLTDPLGKKPGWQTAPDQPVNRDLSFFDAMLESLRSECQVDERRIYVSGHSNGGGFTYFLWAARGDVFAAVAPTAAFFPPDSKSKLEPKPVLHLAGEGDTLVKFAWQQATLEALREVNQCSAGEPAGEFCTRYPSAIGMPVVAYIHPGGHELPSEAIAVITDFFKAHAKPE